MKKRNAQASSGFDSLLGTYTSALEENSRSIEDMLAILTTKKLTEKSKKELKAIKRELNRIDSNLEDLDDLGGQGYGI